MATDWFFDGYYDGSNRKVEKQCPECGGTKVEEQRPSQWFYSEDDKGRLREREIVFMCETTTCHTVTTLTETERLYESA